MTITSSGIEHPCVHDVAREFPCRRNQPRDVVAAYTELCALLDEPEYTAPRRRRILDLLAHLDLLHRDASPVARLRCDGRPLLTVHPNGTVAVAASGRGDWDGRLELVR